MDGNSIALAAIAGLVLPAAGASVAFLYTGDPYLQPLGLTKERLSIYQQEPEFISIGVHVEWGQDRTGALTHADLRTFIDDILLRKTDDYFIKFYDVPGRGIDITLAVGANRYGPYPPSRLIDGIAIAAAALEMTRNALR